MNQIHYLKTMIVFSIFYYCFYMSEWANFITIYYMNQKLFTTRTIDTQFKVSFSLYKYQTTVFLFSAYSIWKKLYFQTIFTGLILCFE